jgi:hypothetical protein
MPKTDNKVAHTIFVIWHLWWGLGTFAVDIAKPTFFSCVVAFKANGNGDCFVEIMKFSNGMGIHIYIFFVILDSLL